MTHKFVLRLLTEEGELLGWCEEHLRPVADRAAGTAVFSTPSSLFRIVAPGRAVYCAIHWCDLDVARKQKLLEPVDIPASHIGGEARLDWIEKLWGVQGTSNVPLPPVTVGEPVVLTPGPAAIGAGV